MSEHHGKTYRPWEPHRYRHEAHSPAAKRPAGDVVFFLLDTMPKLDVSRFYAPDAHETRGAPPCDPAMMVCLLLYAYGVGVCSRRKIAQACERNLACIAMVGTERPDFRTISDVRTGHLDAFADVCVQVLRVAGETGMGKLGNVSTDGTKIQGHAARPKAMSYGSMKKAAERLRAEMEALVGHAHPQDAADDAALGRRRGDELPAELARREDRLATIAAAMQRLEARAKAEADAERQRRAAAERQRTGTTRRGKAPTPVDETPDDNAQTNCTDPELQSMRTNTKGWESCGHAHARVDAAHQISWACDVTAEAHDTQQAPPMAHVTLAHLEPAGIETPRDASGAAQKIPATYDSGYDSEAAAAAVEPVGFDPYMAMDRQRHQAPAAEAIDPPATAKDHMAANVRTPEGSALYAGSTVIVEPVFGQIKDVRGFRRFLRRGWDNIRGAWRLVCWTHHRLKIWRSECVPLNVAPEKRASYAPQMALRRVSCLL